MSKSQANEIMEKIAERRANLTLEENANFKERTEAIENARQQLNKEIRQEIKQGNTVDLNELFNQTPADNTQAQFTFNNDEIKNVRTEKQNVLANDMAKLNNVKSNHDLYKTINAIQSADLALKRAERERREAEHTAWVDEYNRLWDEWTRLDIIKRTADPNTAEYADAVKRIEYAAYKIDCLKAEPR